MGAGNRTNEPEELMKKMESQSWKNFICKEQKKMEEDEKGTKVLKNDIPTATAKLKKGKAVGVAEILAEMLRIMGGIALRGVGSTIQQSMRMKNGQMISQEQ